MNIHTSAQPTNAPGRRAALAKPASMADNPRPLSCCGETAVKIALVLTVETARGLREALPRALDALHAAQASATVCLALGRDAGAPLEGRWRERARWHGWASLWRGRVWPGARLDALAPTALTAIAQAGCVAGLRLGHARRWHGSCPPQALTAQVARFRHLAGLTHDAPLTVNLPGGLASWPVLRQMQALGVGALTGLPGQHGFWPSHHAELLTVPVLPTSLPSLGDVIRAEGGQPAAGVQALLAHTPGPGALCQLDAERAGGVWLTAFTQLLEGWRAQGHAVGTVSDSLLDQPVRPHAELEVNARHALRQGMTRFTLHAD